MRIHDFDQAILRRPGASVVGGLAAGQGPRPTYEGVLQEHRAYQQALEQAGVAVHLLEPLEDFPDSIFVEDPALVFTEGAILLRPGASSRAREGAHLKPVLEALFGEVLQLAEGYADGGDVMVTPHSVLIGLSGRTDRLGAQSLAQALAHWGKATEIVDPPGGALHLKTAASMVDEETVLTTPAGEASGLFSRFRQIVTAPGEEGAANALRVNRHLLVASQYPHTLEKLAQTHEVIGISTEHLARIDAGLSCMSLRWKGG